MLTLLALGSLPLLNVFAKRFGVRLHPAVMGIQQESAELASVVEETVSGVRVVKGFGAEGVQQHRFQSEADDVYDESMKATRVRAVFLPALELLPNIGLILVLGYGGHQVLDGHLSLGSLVAFNVYVVMLIWPLRMLGMILAQSQRAVASSQRVHEVLTAEPEVVDPHHPEQLPAATVGAPTGELRFEGVTFSYPGGPQRPVLEGLDLVVRAGESVALVGPTGCGKTTVARLIPRFYDVDGGRVVLDGIDVRDVSLHDLRHAIGLVFEDTFLFNDSVAANIAFAEPDAPMDRIERAARLAGAHDFIAELPDGYATEIGERGFSLSGGQRQRIAIARAILADPRVLILDDATSSVDPTKEHEIRDALTEVMRGRTTIVIAHRPATIALADRVVLLDEGSHRRRGHPRRAAGDERALPRGAGVGHGGPPGLLRRRGGDGLDVLHVGGRRGRQARSQEGRARDAPFVDDAAPVPAADARRDGARHPVDVHRARRPVPGEVRHRQGHQGARQQRPRSRRVHLHRSSPSPRTSSTARRSFSSASSAKGSCATCGCASSTICSVSRCRSTTARRRA